MMWMKKDPKIVYLAYKITAHTTNCMDIYDLQHIVLHAACLLAAGILSRPRRKCEDIMPLLAISIMYYCINIVSPCVHDTLVPRREALLNIDTPDISYPGESFASGGSHSCLGKNARGVTHT